MALPFLTVDLSLSWLIDEASPKTIQRGQSYYRQNRVRELRFYDHKISGTVLGTDSYHITIDTENETAQCECPAEYPCKHLIAAVYAISAKKRLQRQSRGYQAKPSGLETSTSETAVHDLIVVIDSNTHCKFMGRDSSTGSILPIKSNYETLKLPDGKTIQPVNFDFRKFNLYFGCNHEFILNNLKLRTLPRFYSDGITMKFRGYISIRCRLQKYERNNNLLVETFYLEFFYVHPETGNEIILDTTNSSIFDLQTGILIRIKKSLAETEMKSPPQANGSYHDYYILQSSNMTQVYFLNFQRGMSRFSEEDLVGFQNELKKAGVENLKQYLPRLYKHGPVVLFFIYPEEGKNLKIRGRWEFLYAYDNSYTEIPEKFEKAVKGKNLDRRFARFDIVKKRINNRKEIEKSYNGNLAKINLKNETRIIYSLLTTDYFKGTKTPVAISGSKAMEFVSKDAAELTKRGVKIQVHKSLARIISGAPAKVKFRITGSSSGVRWFDGELESTGLSLNEIRRALKAYRKKEDFVKMGNGEWVSLDMIGIKGLMQSIERLGVKINVDGKAKSMTRGEVVALSLEKTLDERSDLAVAELKEKILALPEQRKKFPADLDSSFQGTLRDYQKEGIFFLESLYETGIGGILADDMGLGKTIQGLGFLDRLAGKKNNLGKPMLALIAGPLASISVWKKEAERFFPNLRVTLWHGSGRLKTEFPRDGIILTTYGTLQRDYESWNNRHFDVAILDEAQNLKNYASMSSHAVRSTSVSVYFCLTGTPLENHLMDLWSLFDICFPGYLGNRKSFANYSDDLPPDFLRRKITPFVLRRTKSDVLKELPQITETMVPIAMTNSQKSFYEEARKLAFAELAAAGKDYLMVMLPHLMRLRRIACHPQAGNPDEADILESGKFQYLRDTLPELIETSSGILIFSQFTDILKICGRLIKDLGFDYFYLDGKTPLMKRNNMVQQFQEGEKPCFLISLKAGGTAITLHRADTVIHLDPWWNPAVERQATDRAHRIGQKQKVFVYKLYSQNSIEEKVLELQNLKKEMFNALFGEKMLATGKISRDQLRKLIDD
jgi:SNF2 family DNA or RNA helicase